MRFARAFLIVSISLKLCPGADCGSLLPRAFALPSGWRVVTLEDLPEDDRDLWGREHAGQCPGAVVGRFTDDSRYSYAVALLQSGPGGKLLEQLVAILPAGNRLSRVVLVKPTTVVSPFVVWAVPPGKYAGVDGAPAVSVPHDSIIYEKMEATANQFFYLDGRFRSIQTAE